jgi:hypothetical protein
VCRSTGEKILCKLKRSLGYLFVCVWIFYMERNSALCTKAQEMTPALSKRNSTVHSRAPFLSFYTQPSSSPQPLLTAGLFLYAPTHSESSSPTQQGTSSMPLHIAAAVSYHYKHVHKGGREAFLSL